MCSEILFHITLKEDFLKTESVYFYYYLFFKRNFSILYIFFSSYYKYLIVLTILAQFVKMSLKTN